MNEKSILKIRDGVDLYLIGDDIITVYFMNTRKKLKFRANQLYVDLLELIDGELTIKELRKALQEKYDKTIDPHTFITILSNLEKKGIINVQDIYLYQSFLSNIERLRFDRQLNFFGDFLPSGGMNYEAQRKIRDTKVLIFGCGAIGGWISVQLAMAGVNNFILFDGDRIQDSDISRHVYYNPDQLGQYKVDGLSNFLMRISSNIQTKRMPEYLSPETNISRLVEEADFIINTADEPYIGYTSIKISRECIRQIKPHFIGGGFDAHLASTGELIIPGVTPCVDCYANHFKIVLKDWKPKPHPVINRHLEIGGLSALSLFSSSYAVIEILKYIGGLVNMQEVSKSRGEFLFNSMSIDYLDVSRDPNCKTCGGV